jgi:hypothetical protein
MNWMNDWTNKQTKSNKLPSKATSTFSDLIPMGLSVHVFTPRNVVTNSLCSTCGIVQRRFDLDSDCILWFEEFNWDRKYVFAKFVVCLSNLCSIDSNRCCVPTTTTTTKSTSNVKWNEMQNQIFTHCVDAFTNQLNDIVIMTKYWRNSELTFIDPITLWDPSLFWKPGNINDFYDSKQWFDRDIKGMYWVLQSSSTDSQ